MKKIMFFALILSAFSFSSCTDKEVNASELPNKAKVFLQTYFPDVTYTVFLDYDGTTKSYDVTLYNGAYVEFDKKGEWEKVSYMKGVPTAIIPEKILEYCTTNYPAYPIVKIDREYKKYDIELSNYLDLEFDLNGNFIRIDD